MSFLAELKRRHVVRVGLTYAAVAFAIVQGADLAFPRLGLPDWTITFVLALTLLGLPVALVLAWAYEITPDGVRRTEGVVDPAAAAVGAKWLAPQTVVLVMGALVVAGAAGWFARGPPVGRSQ